MIYFRGTGFDAQTYDNKVLVGTSECEVNDYFTTETNLACQLPYAEYNVTGSQDIVVKVRGNPIPINGHNKTIELSRDYTPFFNSIYPMATWPGQEIRIFGVHRAHEYSDVQSLKLSDFNCEIDSEDVDAVKLNFGEYRTLTCKVPESILSGRHLIQMNAESGTGFSKTMKSAEYYGTGSSQMKKFNVQIHPKIESVSPAGGYMNCQRLTITGRGFGSAAEGLSIEVMGIACKVESASDSQIVCVMQKTDSVESKKVYEGNAGLKMQNFRKEITIESLYQEYKDKNMDINEAQNEHAEGDEDKTVFISSILSMEEKLEADPHVHRMFGIFTATSSGEYTFYTAGNDKTRLSISKTAIDEGAEFDEDSMMQLLCDQAIDTDFQMYYWHPDDSICKVTLEAGKKYFLVYLHMHKSTDSHFSLAVEVPGSNSSLPNTSSQIQEIKINNNAVREVQEIKLCGATSGTYSITFSAKSKEFKTHTTEDIDWNASASSFREAVFKATKWWHLGVTRRTLDAGGNETSDAGSIDCFEYTLTYDAYKGEYLDPFVNTKGLSPNTAKSTVKVKVEPSAPVAGTFKLSYDGEVTDTLQYSESALSLRTNLEKMAAFAEGVTVYDKDHHYDGKTWYIALDSVKGDGKNFRIVDENLSGGANGSPTMSVKANFKSASNNLFFRPIGPDFLSTFHAKPQVRLIKGGIRAVCPSQSCDYSFITDDDTPSISAFDVSSNPVTLTLKAGYDSLPDASLLANKDNFDIRFGGYTCSSVSVSGATISCSLPEDSSNKPKYQAGSLKPEVYLKDKGFLIIEASANEVDPVVTSVSPSSGSTGGDTLLTISGKHFADDKSLVTVSVGSYPCELVSATLELITCKTSAQASAGNDKLTVTVNSKTFTDNGGTLFQYSSALSPTLTGLDKQSVSPILKQILTINGNQFGNDPSAVTVMLVPKANSDLYPLECFKVDGQVTNTSIKCHLTGGKSGSYTVQVIIDGVGTAVPNPATAGDLKMEIVVDSVSGSSGSVEGGHLITISGQNFSAVPTDNQVVFGDNSDMCRIESATATEIKCRTMKPKEVLSGPQTVYVFGRITEEAICSGTCKYTFDSAKTPTVTQISPVTVKSGDTVTITGTKLKSSSGKSTVYLGDYEVPENNILSVTDTSLEFKMPGIHMPQFELGVNVDGYGQATLSVPNQQKLIENPFKVLGIDRRNGVVGGDIFVVSGNGFISEEQTSVQVGNQGCYIQAFSHDEITCWALRVPGGTNSTKSLEVTNETKTVVGDKTETNSVKETCSACTYTTQQGQAPGINTVTNADYSNLNSVKMTITGPQLKDNVATAAAYLFAMDQTAYPKLKFAGNVAAGSGSDDVDLTFYDVTAGNYTILYHIPSLGFAQRETPAENILLSESDVAIQTLPTQSYMGGNLMNFSGKGFLNDDYKGEYSVTVCGNECRVTQSSFSNLQCEIPMLNTKETQAQLNLVEEQVLKNAKIINDSDDPDAKINDGNFGHYYSGQENCYIGYDFGEGNIASVSKIRLFPALNQNETDLVGAVVQGAMSDPTNESNWTDLFTLNENFAENWNSFFPEQSAGNWEYRYLRLKNSKYCRISEFEVTGRVFNNISNFDISNTSCDVLIKRGDTTVATLTGGVTYSNSAVATVTAISPEIISTGGGETVTITGTNLDKNGTVEIDGISCAINAAQSSSTKIVCVTGPRPEFTKPSLHVMSSAGLAVTGGKLFLYADRWSETATWGGESLPREGDLVHVPVGQTLLVDVPSVPRLASMVVEGMVIFHDFDNNGQEKTFDSSFIMVRDGVLRIGTEDEPYESKLTITLHGDRDSASFPGFGNKNIMVQG